MQNCSQEGNMQAANSIELVQKTSSLESDPLRCYGCLLPHQNIWCSQGISRVKYAELLPQQIIRLIFIPISLIIFSYQTLASDIPWQQFLPFRQILEIWRNLLACREDWGKLELVLHLFYWKITWCFSLKICQLPFSVPAQVTVSILCQYYSTDSIDVCIEDSVIAFNLTYEILFSVLDKKLDAVKSWVDQKVVFDMLLSGWQNVHFVDGLVIVNYQKHWLLSLNCKHIKVHVSPFMTSNKSTFQLNHPNHQFASRSDRNKYFLEESCLRCSVNSGKISIPILKALLLARCWLVALKRYWFGRIFLASCEPTHN